MQLNEKNFLNILNNFSCFENKPHIAVGVSGGPDSMALTYLLNKWIKLKKGQLYPLVFDHSIRANSKQEAYEVKNILKELNLRPSIIKVNKNKVIKKSMANARLNRFKGLINFCKKNNLLHLFLGHHFDDNVETYLIRKINGSNLEGLGAMNNVSYFNNILIIRPFMEINKLSILNFNKKNKIKYIIDPSNQNLDYTRVKVRNFLNNITYKKFVKNDFFKIKKEIPNYKKMIWELLIYSFIDVQPKRIQIYFDKLINNDDLIIQKHILIILKFFSDKKAQTKSSKINLFIETLKKPSFKNYNLRGVNIQKKSNLLIFSEK